MKNILLLSFGFIQMTVVVKAQSFEFIYSTPADEIIQDVIQDGDGNYYLTGWQGVPGSLLSGLVIKLNPAGDTIKTLTIPPFNNYLYLEHIISLNDSVFVIVGDAQMINCNDWQILYYKIDNDLNILDFNSFGDAHSSEHVMRLRKGYQNELLLTGYSYDTSMRSSIFLYEISEDGDSLHSFYPGYTLGWISGFDVLNLPDTSGYFLFTFGDTAIGNNRILKISNLNNIDTIVHMTGDIIVTAKWLNDSVFATINSKNDTATFPPYVNLQFRKYDRNLNLLSDTLMGSIDTNDMQPNSGIDFINPDNIFAGGTINYSNFWSPDPAFFYLVGFDNSMTPQWQKIISHNDDYLNLWGVYAANDGGVLLYGTKYNDQTSGSNERDIYVIKLDSLGNFATGINNISATEVHNVIIYPNPAHDVIHINSTINFPAAEFKMFDASGRLALQKSFYKNTSFSVEQLNNGIYFYEIKDAKGKAERGKIVKE